MKARLNLSKLRIGLAIALTAIAGLMVGPGTGVAPWQGALLALAVLVSSAAAGAFNQFWEVDLDARMGRTRNRPFVTGLMRPHAGWLALIVGLTGLAVALAWFVANASAALFTERAFRFRTTAPATLRISAESNFSGLPHPASASLGTANPAGRCSRAISPNLPANSPEA